MRKSRLSKYSEKKTKKTIILSLLGIIVVLYLLFKFGIGLLINFSLFLSGKGNQQSLSSQNTFGYITPPTLNPIPNATNSAQIIITGSSIKESAIELYVNNNRQDETKANDNGQFIFDANLKNGTNEIQARTILDNKKSELSNILIINYISSAPNLEVTFPQDGQQFKKEQNSINITGKTDSGVSITVNGFWAIINDNNNFSYNLPLQNGDNEIIIIATDQAGNKTEKKIKVNYSQ